MTTRTQKTNKKPKRWKPKVGEMFYYISMPVMPFHENPIIICEGTLGTSVLNYDKMVKTGNCFRTQREAQAMAKRLLKVLKEG